MTIFSLVLYLYHVQWVSTQFPWHSMDALHVSSSNARSRMRTLGWLSAYVMKVLGGNSDAVFGRLRRDSASRFASGVMPSVTNKTLRSLRHGGTSLHDLHKEAYKYFDVFPS